MKLQTAFPVYGAPAFGTFGGGNMEELHSVRDAGMNLVVTGEGPLDPSSEPGAFCQANGIQVMYSLASHIHGRPALARDIAPDETTIPIVDGAAPCASGVVVIDDERVRYREATADALIGCERGIDGTVPAAHHQAVTLFWPDLAAEEVARVKASPNLWGYWVLDDTPGFTRSAQIALNAVVKQVDGPGHAVCAGHSGLGTLRNFAPGSCDILAFYYYPFGKDGYLRTLNTVSTQWTLSEARRLVPGIPFLGVFQGFWESPASERQVNCADPLAPWQIREQIEDFVRDGAAGILGYATITGNATFAGWNARPELVSALRDIGSEIRATGACAVTPEPPELQAVRIQPQGGWDVPNEVPGVVPAWHLAGPFDAGDRGFAASFGPEAGFDADAPGGWRIHRTVLGALGLIETYGSPTRCTNCTAYAACTVTSPVEQQVQMRFGSDDDAIVWIDGVEAWRHEGSRGVVPDDDVTTVTLPAGEARILVKVHNRLEQWGLFMRFADLEGRPLTGLRFSPDPDDPAAR